MFPIEMARFAALYFRWETCRPRSLRRLEAADDPYVLLTEVKRSEASHEGDKHPDRRLLAQCRQVTPSENQVRS